MSEKPVVRIRLTERKTLRMKLPLKNARWHGAYKNVDEATKAAMTGGIEPPFLVEYVEKED